MSVPNEDQPKTEQVAPKQTAERAQPDDLAHHQTDEQLEDEHEPHTADEE